VREAATRHEHTHHIPGVPRSDTPWWRSRSGIVPLGFLAVAAFFLLTEHTAHVFGALPWLLLLACPLMHLFMHGGHGHGGHGHGGHGGRSGDAGRPDRGGSP
jgi:hypothetical protein